MKNLNKEQLEFMNGYIPANIHDIYEYAAGGGIHIKPSHEGRFTAYKKRTGKTTKEALHSKDPHVRQMANFARNAAKWKHQDGGSASSNDQVMQIIQAYAQAQGVDPNELISEIQKMNPDQQKKALAKMYQAVTGKQMQEGGPAPEPNGIQEYPQGQEPQGGQINPEQILQAVQQMLQQGATPEDVIHELLNEQIDPQMIAQILVQVGVPEQEVMQDIQNVMGQMQQGSVQEQENPEEQMQEQGQEEPQGQPMAYGGTPRFYFGGYNNFAAPGVLKNSRFNNTMLGVNALADPTVSAIPFISTMENPISAVLGIGAGALATGAGFTALGGLGYKDKGYGEFFNRANNNASKIPDSIKLSTPSSTGEMWDKYNASQRNDLWSKHNPKQDPFKVSNYNNWKPGMQTGGEYSIGDDTYTTTPSDNPVVIPTSGSYPISYQNLPDNMQPKMVPRVDPNGKPLSRNQIAANQKEYNTQRLVQPEYEQLTQMYNWIDNNPGATQDDYYAAHKLSDKFSVTGDDSGCKKGGRCKGAESLQKVLNGKAYGGDIHFYDDLPHAQFGISEGFNFNDPYGLNAPRFGQTANYADAQQYGANFNARPLEQPLQPMSKPAAGVDIKPNLNIPSYKSKSNPNAVNANKKVINTYNMSGPGIATNMINALGMSNYGFGFFQQKQQRKAAYEHDKFINGQGRMITDIYNSPNANGERTVNSGTLKPGMYTPIQDANTTQYGKYGGSTKYQQGGEYHVTHDELLHLMRNGAEVEFL